MVPEDYVFTGVITRWVDHTGYGFIKSEEELLLRELDLKENYNTPWCFFTMSIISVLEMEKY